MHRQTNVADQIAQEMQQVRADMHHDVRHLVAQARTLTDWRHYVRAHPWVCVGAAAALGYLAIPARRKVIQLDATGVRELAKNQQLVVRVAGDTQQRPGLLRTAAGMATRALLNGGLQIVAQQFSQIRDAATTAPAGEKV